MPLSRLADRIDNVEIETDEKEMSTFLLSAGKRLVIRVSAIDWYTSLGDEIDI